MNRIEGGNRVKLSNLQDEAGRRQNLMACLSLGILSTTCPDAPEDARILEIDEQFTKLTGYTMDDIKDSFCGLYLELVDERDRARVAELLRVHASEAELICRMFRQTFIDPDADYKISCSVGIAISNKESRFAELFKKADAALYQAKSHGKDCYCIYEE